MFFSKTLFWNSHCLGILAINKELAPRFKKSVALPGAVEDLQMRPAANSLLYKANNLKPQSLPLQSPQSGKLYLVGFFLFELCFVDVYRCQKVDFDQTPAV